MSNSHDKASSKSSLRATGTLITPPFDGRYTDESLLLLLDDKAKEGWDCF